MSTNDFTNTLKGKLDSIEIFTAAEKTQGALATGNAVLPTVKDVADKTQFAPNENGTILYHNTKWFTPTGTISTNGTTATSTSAQFNSGMVGAKLTILGEEKIISSYISSTQVTVNSAYSQNYNSVSLGNWGIYSIAIIIDDDIYSFTLYNTKGVVILRNQSDDANSLRTLANTSQTNAYGLTSLSLSLGNAVPILISSTGIS